MGIRRHWKAIIRLVRFFLTDQSLTPIAEKIVRSLQGS